ncbi:MAG: Gfo/Idh/MocA family oxidoreductase [Deltaproteobacteria bacterium]|nr:Gfo/Idh/MocA family oxidoreductase [Deltaproteobacteria bacterium]MBW2306189.1 Gfo/Idh/MocA family oxidoreductase [Deltaproteobacteria bacterium]
MQGTQSVAVVGAGYWGRNLVRNFASLDALKTVCDLNPKVLERVKSQYPWVKTTESFRDVLESPEVEALVVATPAEHHYSLALEALRAEKHVFVEKPMALRLEDGEDLVEQAQKVGRTLMVGHLLEYHPAVPKMKDLIDAGELGRIQYVYSNRLNLGKVRNEENILWSFAPHDISIILRLLGEMPTQVTALGGNYLRPGIADVTISTMSFDSGVKAHIFVSWLHPYKEQRLVVVGDQKMMVFNDVESKDKLLLFDRGIDWKERLPVPRKEDAVVVPIEELEPLRLECEHFLSCIRDGSAPRTDGNNGLKILRILHACQESLERAGEPVIMGRRAERSYFLHPTSIVDEHSAIGEGTRIWHFSHVMKNARIGCQCNIGQNVVVGSNVAIGDHVKIQNNVSVYEGVILEDYVFCGPSMVFTNVINPRSEIPRKDEFRPTIVRRGATIGANATILCGHTIGEYAFVGAGAVVTRDVPAYGLVLGNPAKLAGWMCRCGNRIAAGEDSPHYQCSACGREYVKEEGSIRPVSAPQPAG